MHVSVYLTSSYNFTPRFVEGVIYSQQSGFVVVMALFYPWRLSFLAALLLAACRAYTF